MNNYNKYKTGLHRMFSILIFSFAILSCETTELNILDDPNSLTESQGDINLLLNNVQVSFGTFMDGTINGNNRGVSEFGMEVTRISHMFGPTYENAYAPANFDVIWSTAYSEILQDIRLLNPLAEQTQNYTHIAIGQIIEAYVIITLVDYFGDIPYSEALRGLENLSPGLDSGEEVYAAAEALLNDAIANLGRDAVSEPTTDLFYNGGLNNWINLANTLKLKMYLQTRLVDSQAASKINALIADGNLIDQESEDFMFSYSTNNTNPDSRHPVYVRVFPDNTHSGFYASIWYMNQLLSGNGIDPRIRYYFYRQNTNYDGANSQTKSCVDADRPTHFGVDDPFCTIGVSGYWGRDHGDEDGIPPDGANVTLPGPYPYGGVFDDDQGTTIRTGNLDAIGNQGSGISPIMMSSYVDFMLAEASLTLGVSGNPRTYLESGIRKSIETVVNFSDLNPSQVVVANDPDTQDNETVLLSEFIPTSMVIQSYIDGVLATFDNAGSNDERLNIIVTQYFLALWGNGVEAYNTFRRTGKPNNLQPTRTPTAGSFIRLFLYPATADDNNSNISQRNVSEQVFWDTNPAGFIN